jgi:hypothetical protein
MPNILVKLSYQQASKHAVSDNKKCNFRTIYIREPKLEKLKLDAAYKFTDSLELVTGIVVPSFSVLPARPTKLSVHGLKPVLQEKKE